MRRLRFLGLLILTGLLTLQSCSKDNETTIEPQPNNDEVTPETPQTTTSKLSKVNIGDAKFIVKANSNNLKKKSLQKSDKIEKEIEDSFFKITESGNVEPIVFTN